MVLGQKKNSQGLKKIDHKKNKIRWLVFLAKRNSLEPHQQVGEKKQYSRYNKVPTDPKIAEPLGALFKKVQYYIVFGGKW